MQLTALSLALTRAGFLSVFTPASLFSAGEQGVWYDPSDMSTMFQDSAGTPVTGMEQPVGLILDKSRGLVLGPERVTNGDFSNGANGWAAIGSATLSVIGGTASVTVTGPSGGIVSSGQSLGLTVGSAYQVSFDLDISAMSAGGVEFRVAGVGIATIPTSGSKKVIFFAPSNNPNISVQRVGGAVGTFTIDNISVRELPGNHAFQTTTTSRPVLSARVNLLTATETLATQTVTTRATTQTLRFEGTGTVTLSGTATGTYSAGSHSITTTAGNLTLTVSGEVTKADLRATNMGVGLPAYQRVNTSTDYDTAGFPMYLRFDGVDDWLVTPSINFTSTDKMTVFAGSRYFGDAGGIICELSENAGPNNGTFLVAVNDFSAGRESVGARATILAGAQFIAPNNTTRITTRQIDFAQPTSATEFSMRINGVVQIPASTTVAEAGSGNYGNYPLYIGRRGGTSFPFNGHIYSLIVRGAQSTAQQITQTEQWVNGKTKAY